MLRERGPRDRRRVDTRSKRRHRPFRGATRLDVAPAVDDERVVTERAQTRNPGGRRSSDGEPADVSVAGPTTAKPTRLLPTVQSPRSKKSEARAARGRPPDGWNEERLAILRVLVRALARAEIREQIQRAGSRSKRA